MATTRTVKKVVSEVATPTEIASVKVIAVEYKMRNPVTGITYQVGVPMDVNDLNAPENHFVRSQLRAGVMKVVGG